MNIQGYQHQPWFLFLSQWQRQQVMLAFKLYNREENSQDYLVDYSYILFPMMKSYEGFLKKYLYDVGLIDQDTYEGTRFRIGRALNPDVSIHQRDKYWLYDDIVRNCGETTARHMWQTWLKCRNRVFHFFPKEKAALELAEVKERLDMAVKAMDLAVTCLENKNDR